MTNVEMAGGETDTLCVQDESLLPPPAVQDINQGLRDQYIRAGLSQKDLGFDPWCNNLD